MSDSRSPGSSRAADEVPANFERFYRRHGEPMLVFFARRTFDADVALELTAETFATAYANRANFRGKTAEEAGAWLYAIARSQLHGFYKRGEINRRHLARLGLQVPQYSDEDLERVETLAGLTTLRRDIGALFHGLPSSQRAAVHLRVFEECSYDEVARRLDISEQTARARVSRGLRALRAQLPDLPKEMFA